MEPSGFAGPHSIGAAPGGMAREDPVIDVIPADLIVRAAVEVSFAIEDVP